MQLAASMGEETKVRRSDGEMVRIDKIRSSVEEEMILFLAFSFRS